jgi:hypothetical protein
MRFHLLIILIQKNLICYSSASKNLFLFSWLSFHWRTYYYYLLFYEILSFHLDHCGALPWFLIKLISKVAVLWLMQQKRSINGFYLIVFVLGNDSSLGFCFCF